MADMTNSDEIRNDEDENVVDITDTEDSEDDFDETDDILTEEDTDDLGEDTTERLNRGEFSPNYFNTSKDNTIEWYTGQSIVTYTVSQRKWINRILKLHEQYPDEVKITKSNKDGCIVAHLPLSYIGVRHPKRVSEEQKERMRLQAKKNIAEGKFGRKKKAIGEDNNE